MPAASDNPPVRRADAVPESGAGSIDPPVVSGALTRGQAAAALGVSKSTVRRMESTGALRPVAVVGGVRYFAPQDVEALAVRSHHAASVGDLAAVTFRRFNEGATLRDLVIELRQPPEVLRELRRQWSMDWEAGEKERRRQEAAARDEREAREHERLMRQYDRDAREAEKLAARAAEQEREAERLRVGAGGSGPGLNSGGRGGVGGT